MTKRNTVQQKIVLEAVNALKNHASAEEIYEYIVKKYPSIGRATVYRILQRLSEEKKIKKIEELKGAERYDHDCSRHYHIRCIKCGRLFDADIPYIEDLEKNLRLQKGFTVTGHSIVFTGVCPDCNEKS